MVKIKDLTISFFPFGLNITIKGGAEKRIRGTDIVLPVLNISDGLPHNPVTFEDVLEYTSREIASLGLHFSYLIEHHDQRIHLKRVDLAKHFGRRLNTGSETMSFANNTEVWHWTAHYEVSGKKGKKEKIIKELKGKELDELFGHPTGSLRHVNFHFGVAGTS